MARHDLSEVTIYTDGACSGNPGPGGWAAILRFAEHEKELSGGDAMTTNNQMELRAAIEGLRALKRPCRVTIYTDSTYLMHAFTQGWLDNWERNGWRTKSGDQVKNIELWQELRRVMKPHLVKWQLVKGHAGDALNERADRLAVQAAEAARQEAP